MFKRLRDGIFKRQDADQDEQDELEATETPSQVDEAMAPSDASTREASVVATDAPADAPMEAPGESDGESDEPGEADELFGSATAIEPPIAPPAPIASVAPSPAPSAPVAQQADADLTLVDEDPEVEEAAGASGQRRGLFNPFKLTLGRTRQLFGRVNESLAHEEITEDLWDELEETLISSDVGVQTTERLMNILHERVTADEMTRGSELRAALKDELELLLGDPEPLIFSESSPITVLLFVGVNGVGKTTSIAKLANLLKKQKHRVMLAAGDTFRAAAVEQLKTWGERVGVPVVAHQQGVDPNSVADPAAVVFDAMQSAQARGTDVLIVDTAGRLHTKVNLMDELKKIVRVLQKYDPEAPHEVLLVLDATTGQNGLAQAKQFVQDAGVSGVILTKLDGTARGGIVFAIASELGLPIKFIGTGERVGDIAPFNVEQFINALFDED